MGVCVSRCGDAHQRAAVAAAASISNHNSCDHTTDSPHDPNHSLKNFLHLYDNVDANKSEENPVSSPRFSFGGESLAMPHSSELFSLPASEAERSSFAVSPTPARTSRASVSSRFNSSPKSRNSFSVWGGRFSTEKSSVGCRKRIRPARNFPGAPVEQELAAHQRLIDAIARLERLNDGKNLGLRGSSFCSSDLNPKSTQLLAKSRSGEFKRAGLQTSRSRHVRHYQLPLQLPKSAIKDHDFSRPEAFSQSKRMGNLVSLAAPVIKQMPLEKSVSNFLREVDNFVSLIEAPRLSLSSEAMAETTDGRRHEPVIITTVSKRVEERNSVRDDTDSEELFTFFEASFGDSAHTGTQQLPVAKSLQRLVQSATQGCHRIEKSFPAGEAVANCARECQSTSSDSHSLEQSATTTEVDPVSQQSMREEKVEAARPALTQIDTNIGSARPALTEIDKTFVPVTLKSPIVRKSPSRMRALKGFRRGFSRSLDSRDGGVVHVDFDLLRNPSRKDSIPTATGRLSNASETKQTTEVASHDAKSTHLEFPPLSSFTSCPDGKLEEAGCEQKENENCTYLNTPTVELATWELPSQDPVPSTIAESTLRELENLDNVAECPQTVARSCDEKVPSESTECTVSSPPSLSISCSGSQCQNGILPVPVVHSDVGDSERFLSKAFNSLLKFLQVTNREQAGPVGNVEEKI